MEIRSGLVVGAVVSHADGFGERASALRLLDCVPGRHAKTLGADKGYDMRDWCAQGDAARRTQRRASRRQRDRRPYLAARRLWHQPSDSQTHRRALRLGKTVGRIRQTAYRGLKRVDQHFKLTMLASNLTRMARMLTVVPQGVTQ